MGKIEKIIKKGPVEGQTTEVYPVTSTKAVYDENNKRLDNIITGLQESVSGELNTISKKIVPAINEVNTLAKSKGNGTITEVRMNGASKGTSGVVDLGTVLTEHQDISEKQDKTDNTLATTSKTVIGAINEINTKVGNLTGALTWKGKLDTLPVVTDYEAGNVVGVDNKEYVLTVTGSTKAWEELGDEGSYLLKSKAEETYAKKTDIPTIPAIPTVNNPKVSIKMNGTEKGSFTLNQASAGEVDLGTVITAHQDISGKVDKSAAIGSLSLSLDSTNYKITLSGTKVDGTTFTVSDVIDLPLESVVVNGSYNNTTKKVVLTLQSGSTVEFSVADLVSGLQSEITSTNKLSADLIADGTTNKVVTASEKTTWNGKQDALTNADVLTGITLTKVSNWDNAATNSHTHSNKSVLDGISSADITNWNSKTDNVGTVTGVKMNGTTNNPTNGVVDLGTVLTAHQDISGKQDKLISGTNIKTINGESVLGSGDITISSGASSSAYPEVNHGTNDTTFTLTPNTFHVWDEVTSLTLNFGSGISGVANEYLFQFTSGSTATSLTLPDDIKWANDTAPTIGANMIYQVSVLRGLASVLEFNNAIVFPIIGPNGGSANEEYAKVYEYFVSTYNLTSAFPRPSNGVIITETLICNDTNYGGPVLKVSLNGSDLLLWTQNAIDRSFVPRINNLGVYSTYYWD